MNKNILLVEPAYKSKYPPLGLMKLATYHKRKNDNVLFVKGCNPAVRHEIWDRIYITTLFTYTWKETIKTINYYRDTLFNYSRDKIYVGGILASLMPDEIFNETGIQPVTGLLTDPAKINQDDNVIIDSLPPDYDILQQVPFKYSYTDAYLGYTTRGCIRRCEFCAVRRFEPEYVPYIDIKNIVSEVNRLYKEKQNLVLMDNNVLASKYFDKVIDDIKSIGFYKGATFGKTKKKRFVDFNQGLDARLLTEDKIKKLAEIPLEPVRIAFDSIKSKEAYIKAVKLAHKYGFKNLSNYILFNEKDTPEDFYRRLRINVDLNEKFQKEAEKGKGVKTAIYSFPMKFTPLDAKSRNPKEDLRADLIGPHWNRRYLRGLQVIFSVMRGPVMPGKSFFLQAFGRNPEEMKTILLMPDTFIRYRLIRNWKHFKSDKSLERNWAPYVRSWMKAYNALSAREKAAVIKILSNNNIQEINTANKKLNNKHINKILSYHINAEAIVAKYKSGKQKRK